MQNQMCDLVAERVARKLVGRVTNNEEAALGLNPASPRLEFSGALELLPISRLLKNIDVRLCITCGLFALKLLRHHAVMELRFHGNRGHDKAVDEVIDEMLRLAVLPLFRVNGQRLLTKWVRVSLA